MKVWIDRDSFFLFYQTAEPIYGRAPVELSEEILERHNRVMDELTEVQNVIAKAWHSAQYDGQLGDMKTPPKNTDHVAEDWDNSGMPKPFNGD